MNDGINRIGGDSRLNSRSRNVEDFSGKLTWTMNKLKEISDGSSWMIDGGIYDQKMQ